MSASLIKTCSLIIVLAPLAAAVLCGVLSRILRSRTHWLTILGVAAAFAASLVLLSEVRHAPATSLPLLVPIYDWFSAVGSSTFKVEFLIDPLSAIMLVTVTGVALLVVIYSRDYMREHGHPEPGYERFFAFLALFVFSMCMLVLGGNFLLLYLGWEAVGLCSYLLIGFYYTKPSAAAAAKKAFLVNRVGDFGFGLAILLIYRNFGTLEYTRVFDFVQQGLTASGAPLTGGMLTTIALLLLCGACGKSAQLPLHVWLPDAMEGPSPVSALIHAATMVTAGVYMMARCGAIFASSATAMTVVAVIGATTALFAATIALVQTDMKRILAYSTISQLGYMFLAVGVFAADSAIFHLFTHAFFKALLFLAAGSVMHALGGVIDIRHFGGLRKLLPWTFATCLIGSMALAGVPMLSGFFSKDEILHHAWSAHPVLGGVGIVTAALTAFYTFRMVFSAFFGPQRVPEGCHPHESGGWMLLPLVVLSIGAIGAGYLGVEPTGRWFHGFLAPVFAKTYVALGPSAAHSAIGEHGANAEFWAEYGFMVLSGAISLAAIFAAYVVYVRQPWIAGLVRATATRAYPVLWNKYYVDEAYDLAVVRPTRGAGRLFVGIDDYFVDGLIWIVTAIPRGFGYLLRGFQTGMLQSYGLCMVAGAAIILVWVL